MPAYPANPNLGGYTMMPLNRARVLNGQTQYVMYRAAGGECSWMEAFEARRAVKEWPNDWSPHPWAGQTYGSPRDAYAVEAGRGVERTTFPVEWWS